MTYYSYFYHQRVISSPSFLNWNSQELLIYILTVSKFSYTKEIGGIGVTKFFNGKSPYLKIFRYLLMAVWTYIWGEILSWGWLWDHHIPHPFHTLHMPYTLRLGSQGPRGLPDTVPRVEVLNHWLSACYSYCITHSVMTSTVMMWR